MIVKIPADAKTTAMRSSTVWFDSDGVLYSAPREDGTTATSIEDIQMEMEKFKNLIGQKKICMILESDSRSTSPPKEQRNLIAEEFNKVTKAMAIISSSPLSRMVANLFFSFKPPMYPYKMFSNVADARAWIKQYL